MLPATPRTTNQDVNFLYSIQGVVYDCPEILPKIIHRNSGGKMTLTKADIVRRVYEDHDTMTKQQATQAVETFLRLSKEYLLVIMLGKTSHRGVLDTLSVTSLR